MNEQRALYRQVAEWLRSASSAVVFTGAGMSTESGIPDFRSPGGIWSQVTPVYFDDFVASAAARHEYWRQKCAAYRDFAQAEPNVGHRILAAWEAANRVQAVITQNIDGLHQAGGSRRVLELHGTARAIACIDCGARFEPGPLVEEFLATDRVPPCGACGGRLKSATISFGQALPVNVLEEACDLASSCDLLLAMGSSLVVEPAASLPRMARGAGARLVIINREPTPQDASADLVLRGSIGEILAEIDAWLDEAPHADSAAPRV